MKVLVFGSNGLVGNSIRRYSNLKPIANKYNFCLQQEKMQIYFPMINIQDNFRFQT